MAAVDAYPRQHERRSRPAIAAGLASRQNRGRMRRSLPTHVHGSQAHRAGPAFGEKRVPPPVRGRALSRSVERPLPSPWRTGRGWWPAGPRFSLRLNRSRPTKPDDRVKRPLEVRRSRRSTPIPVPDVASTSAVQFVQPSDVKTGSFCRSSLRRRRANALPRLPHLALGLPRWWAPRAPRGPRTPTRSSCRTAGIEGGGGWVSRGWDRALRQGRASVPVRGHARRRGERSGRFVDGRTTKVDARGNGGVDLASVLDGRSARAKKRSSVSEAYDDSDVAVTDGLLGPPLATIVASSGRSLDQSRPQAATSWQISDPLPISGYLMPNSDAQFDFRPPDTPPGNKKPSDLEGFSERGLHVWGFAGIFGGRVRARDGLGACGPRSAPVFGVAVLASSLDLSGGVGASGALADGHAGGVWLLGRVGLGGRRACSHCSVCWAVWTASASSSLTSWCRRRLFSIQGR